MARVMEKVAQIRRGDPLDTDTMIGAQASRQQFDKILSYHSDCAGRGRANSDRRRAGGYRAGAG